MKCLVMFTVALMTLASTLARADTVPALASSGEMTREELLWSLAHPEDNAIGWTDGDWISPGFRDHHKRPSSPKAGSLYMDVYQESPVLIDYKGNGNIVTEMSFAVVYMFVEEGGDVVPRFLRAHLVSTGAEGHRTSVGEFDIDSRHRYYVSNTYGSRMDYAQFFIGGIAIHETPKENYSVLGGPASHGCVRQHVKDADAMWNLIGNALDEDETVNIKVFKFGVDVTLPDGSSATDTYGWGGLVNEWLNNSIACTRRGETGRCTSGWAH